MVLADFYSQQLERLGASEIELTSNQPITFTLPDGPHASNKQIGHSQVVQLVQEVASYSQVDVSNLTQTGQTVLGYANVRLDVMVIDQDTWQVRIAPREEGDVLEQPAATPAPAVEAASEPVAEAPAAAAPAHQTHAVEGEVRLNSYLRQMIAKGASDLHMSSSAAPMIRDSGEMALLDSASPLSHEELHSILMEAAPTANVEEFLETSDTDFAHAIPGLARFRANYFMDQNGVGAVFRQIPYEILTPEQLGIPEEVLELCWLSKGLVLVTGPTGSGKSTTLAGLIDYINRHRADHIITIEDPVEFVHPNKKCLVNQREVGTHTRSFKSALRAALREDPDIVLVGEMRDLETISIAVETAETGHLVFGTLHTTTAPSTVDRIIDQFPADQQAQIRTMLGGSLKGVISQVLCKKEGGGRAAAYEILIANSAIANNIREGKTHQLQSLMQTGKSEGMRTMNDSLIELVKSKQVSAKEAFVKSVDKQGLKMMFQSNGIKLELGDKSA